MSVVACGSPMAVFQMTSPVLPFTANTFCWVVWTYSTPPWAITVHSWNWAVLPPSSWVRQAPPSRRTLPRWTWARAE